MTTNDSKRKKRLTVEQLEARKLFAGLWTYVDQSSLPAGLPSFIRTQDFKLATLDSNAIRSQLAAAPADLAPVPTSSSILSIPKPDGTLERFSIFVSSIMAPELAAKFPEIQTYAGQGIDNPASTVRLDLTPRGFHAQVISPDGTYYVDPYSNLPSDFYAVYARGSARLDRGFQELQADILEQKGDGISAGSNPTNSGPVLPRSGNELRTYRTAVAATGEYTQFHGGTVALGQAAIVTAMNRLTGIYQTELSIAFQLVANNDRLVFTDPNTDGYSNFNGFAMLGENQTRVDSVIGNANYDLGHVFSTGGGGVASLGSVGVNSRKAQGVTGLPTPIGDEFYVDFVAHEIGHQFGGNHTFNGVAGNCPARNGSTAYEPGSGTTIQAYAGICASDDLQRNSDPYFHSVSLDEMVRHVDTVIPNVGTRVLTGNAIPNVNAGADYVIPARTPFALTATGSDINAGDQLTYDWQQRDLGPARSVTLGDDGIGPLFRVFVPTTNPTRTFPRLSDLLNNTTVIGERLPTTTRALNFRVVVRDNRAAAGAFDDDNMRISVIDTGTPFAVVTPNTNVTWEGLTFQTIEWDVAGTTANGINAALVDISISTDGGLTYPNIVATGTLNNGSAIVRIPNIPTTQARVRVQGSSNIFFDISNTNFAIVPATRVIDINLGPIATYTENSAPIAIAPSATVTETNVSTYAGGSLSVTIGNNFEAGDMLDIINTGTATNEISISGNQILLGGALIGNYSGPGQSLNITLNSAVNGATVERLLTQILFVHTSEDPSPTPRTVTAFLDNGQNGASNRATVLVNVIPVNDAPRSGNASLITIDEDSRNPAGRTIAQLIEPSFQDPDRGSSLSGIAIFSNTAPSTTGVWEYSIDSIVWSSVGSVTPVASLVLAASTSLRFLPAGDYFGRPTPLGYRAMDDSYVGPFTTLNRAVINVANATTTGPVALLGASISIQIAPVNDPPVTTVPAQQFSVNQDDLFSFTIPTGWFRDVDNAALVYTIISANGNPPPVWLSFDAANNRLVGTPTNEEVGDYSLLIRAADPAGLFTTLPFLLSVINVNDAPSNIELVGSTVIENTTGVFIGTLFATDKDRSDQFTWQVFDQRFAVIGNQLFLTSGSRINYEATPRLDIQIQVTDNGTPPLSLTLTKTIEVLDVNEFAPGLRPTLFNIPESTLGGTEIGFLVAPDGDTDNRVRFRFNGTPPTNFTLDGNTGRISLNPSATLDHESTASFQFFIDAFDNGLPPLATTSSLTLNVADVNEFDPQITSGPISLSERQVAGPFFTKVTASDGDTSQTIRFSLPSSETRFIINPTTGDLSLSRPGLFDFERSPVDSIVVIAQDSGTPQRQTQRTIALSILDANDPPTAASVAKPNQLSNITGLSLGTIAIVDQDFGQKYTILTSDDRFTIQDGNLILAPGKFLSETDPLQISVPIIVTEIGADERSYNLNIAVNRISNRNPWQNRLNPADVNRVGGVNPLDALAIINAVNEGVTQLQFPRPASTLDLPDYDVDGDGSISPLDVLSIINMINGVSSGEGESEEKLEARLLVAEPFSTKPVRSELDDAAWLAAYTQLEEERTSIRRRRI